VTATRNVRLQKFLADRGLASRRQCERYVAEGRVFVNGLPVTEAGTRIDPEKDTVAVDGSTVLPEAPAPVTIVLHKPRGFICSASPAQGRTVYELLPEFPQRLVIAGRLDKNSEGLLVLSNDGDLVQRITHPRFEHLKTYEVTVSGDLSDPVLARLREPVVISGRSVCPASVTLLRKGDKPGRSILEFVLKEGRKRQLRETCARAQLKVHRLVRKRVGDVTLQGLKPGKWRELTLDEVEALKR